MSPFICFLLFVLSQKADSFSSRSVGVVGVRCSVRDCTADSSLFAGFGSGSSTGKKSSTKKKQLPKLKAKTQWDRYCDLKGTDKVVVGVRELDQKEWYTVGKIRSKDNELTELSISRQRALIAEHAKRLFPVQIQQGAVLEWGYEVTSGEWLVVDVKAEEGDSKGIEKCFGFEGVADRGSGMYCHYKDGKIVERTT
mmetsp:Transcript_19062/g.44643  ORF Transcript_19062/g.44643 Transcript_19062/m.44643 type:complete len:196 (-) Transcript_19062:47-634(-)